MNVENDPSPLSEQFTRPTDVVLYVLGASTLAIYLWIAWIAFNYVLDDAFIPMRYALNFHLGNGWVLTKGDPVEGYTSPAQLWLITLLSSFLNLDGTIFALKLIGLGLGLITLVLTARMAMLVWPNRPRVTLLAPFLVVLHAGFTLSMINAMETGLATCLLTWGLVRFIEEERDGRRSPFVSCLVFVGAALTRPELTMVYPAILLLKRRSRVGALSMLAYLLPLGCFEAWRYSTYHDLLPNTYYAKWNPAGNFLDGLQYLAAYGLPLQQIICLPLVIWGFAMMRRRTQDATPIITVACLLMAFVVGSGGDWMLDGRLVTPILPELSLAVVALIAAVADRMYRSSMQAGTSAGNFERKLALGGVCVLLLIDAGLRWGALSLIVDRHDLLETLKPHPSLLRWSGAGPTGRLLMARWVSEHARPGQLVATSELGLVSVMNPLVDFLDFRGLADKHVARMMSYPHDKVGVTISDWTDPRGEAEPYLLQRHPDYVIILDDHDLDHQDSPAQKDYRPADSFDITLDHAGEGTFLVTTWIKVDGTAL